jgi:hypothetical protein
MKKVKKSLYSNITIIQKFETPIGVLYFVRTNSIDSEGLKIFFLHVTMTLMEECSLLYLLYM